MLKWFVGKIRNTYVFLIFGKSQICGQRCIPDQVTVFRKKYVFLKRRVSKKEALLENCGYLQMRRTCSLHPGFEFVQLMNIEEHLKI
jgi:hypothetical protein